jgi:hypothetical protein
MIELSNEELEYLTRRLDQRWAELLHELHHAVAREYRADLRREVELTERLQAKLGKTLAVAAG